MVNEKDEISVILITIGNEKCRIPVMLSVLTHGEKLPPYIIYLSLLRQLIQN
jgi:hypothetical protein